MIAPRLSGSAKIVGATKLPRARSPGSSSVLAPEPELDALRLRPLDMRDHTVAVRGGDERPELRRRIERMTDHDRRCRLGEPVEERVVDVLVDEQARRGEADLAVGEEDPEQRVLDGRLEVGVGADEHRALTAELHQRRGERLRGGGHDPLRRDAAAGEADLRDAGMRRRAPRRRRGRSR